MPKRSAGRLRLGAVLCAALGLGPSGCEPLGGPPAPPPPPLSVVAVGSGGAVFVSRDGGASWQPGDPGTGADLRDVAADGRGRVVAVGLHGTVVYSSDGGSSWRAGGSGTSETLVSVATDGDRWVAVGRDGTALYSTDGGDSWTAAASGTGHFLRAVATDGGGRWLAVGDSLQAGSVLALLSSDGGVSWSVAATGFPWQLVDAAYRPGGWILLGHDVVQGTSFVVEADPGLSSWQILLESSRPLHGLRPDGSQVLVAVGRPHRRCASGDGGATWDCQDLLSVWAPPLWAVAHREPIWVTVGSNGWSYHGTRPDGGWTQVKIDTWETLLGVAVDPGRDAEAPLFAEDFEDGDWLGWGDDGGGYTISVVPTDYLAGDGAPPGSWSLSLTGSPHGDGAFGGIFRLFDDVRPSAVSFDARAATAAPGRYGRFALRRGAEVVVDVGFVASPQGQPVIEVNGRPCRAYAPERWYRIELVNVDWEQSVLDVLVDGAPCADEVQLALPLASVDQLHLYNETGGSQVWFDRIELRR